MTWGLPVTGLAVLSYLGSKLVFLSEAMARQTEAFWTVGSVVLAAGGPLIAVLHLPWVLKPRRWQELFARASSTGHRLHLVLWCLLAVTPFAGLFLPLWMAEEDRRLAAEGAGGKR